MKRIYEVVLKVFATYLFLRFIIFFFSAIGVLVAVTGQPYGEAYSATDLYPICWTQRKFAIIKI